MRIVVMSDTHGSYAALETIVSQQPDADLFIHLGDGMTELEEFFKLHPEMQSKFHCIKGNCDYGSPLPLREIITCQGHRIFATHGHKYQVYFGLTNLFLHAKDADCDIVLYGHTHVRVAEYEEGVYLLNPGSAALPRDGKAPSYAFIDIIDNKKEFNILLQHVNL